MHSNVYNLDNNLLLYASPDQESTCLWRSIRLISNRGNTFPLQFRRMFSSSCTKEIHIVSLAVVGIPTSLHIIAHPCTKPLQLRLVSTLILNIHCLHRQKWEPHSTTAIAEPRLLTWGPHNDIFLQIWLYIAFLELGMSPDSPFWMVGGRFCEYLP